jgi:hypothetical protein
LSSGGLVRVKPGAIILASSFFNMVTLALVVTTDWTSSKAYLQRLALMAFVFEVFFSGVFYSRYDVAESALVTAARSVETNSVSTPAAAPLKASEARAKAVTASGRTPFWGDMFQIGLPYAAFFAFWTLSLALLAEKYNFG